MFVKTPRTATAMALALGLVAPLPVVAQDRPDCTEGVELPCVTDTGAVVETEEELDIYLERFPAEAEEAAGETGAVEASSDAEAAAELPQCAEGSPVPCVTDTGAVVETEVELGSYLDAMADEPAADEAAPEADAEAEPEAAAPAETGRQDEQADVEPPAAENAPAAGDDAEPEAAAEPEPVEPEAPAEAAAEPDPVEPEQPAEAAAEPEPVEPEQPAEAAAEQPAEAAGAEAAAPEAPAVEMPEEVATEPEAAAEPLAEDATEAEAASPSLAEGVTDPVEEGTIESDIPVVESEVPPAAAATDAPESAKVEEMTVTEETARTSDEEFETAVGEEPAARDGDDDDGLSTIQRVIAAGLAGAAIGAITGQGGEVVANTGDRLVVRDSEGDLRVLRDENALLRQPGARVRTETFDDGSTRTTVIREDGTEIVTIRGADGRVLRRTRILPDGQRVVLFDDTRETVPVDVGALPTPQMETMEYAGDEAALRAALAATMAQDFGRNFSLRQIREIRAVRELAPEIEIDAINFATGSAAIRPDQAEELAAIGRTLAAMIEESPGEVFLVEGHTDAVGDASYNLALSDRRAETVALALSEYFDVPPENLVVQGYGESDLKIPTAGAEIENRRANVRRITALLGEETAELR